MTRRPDADAACAGEVITRPGADPTPTLDELLDAVAAALERDRGSLSPTSPLLGPVCRDPLDVLALCACCDRWLDGFCLPAQLGLEHATLGDVHHYLIAYLAHGAGPVVHGSAADDPSVEWNVT